MGRPLHKRNFGNVTLIGPQLVLEAHIGAGAEPCWIVDQPGIRTYTVSSVAGGATPARTGRVRLQNGAPTVKGQARLEVMPYGFDGATATATVELITATPAGLFGPVGSGYTPGDVLTLVGAATTPATVTVTSVFPGPVGPPFFTLVGAPTSYSITTPGDYSIIPSTSGFIFAGVPATGGTGSGAEVTAGFGLLATTVTGGGTGYVSAPPVTFSGISGAAGTTVLTADAVTSITIGAVGIAYAIFGTKIVTPVILAPVGDIENARTINQYQIKTYDGNSYKWRLGVAAPTNGVQIDVPFA